MGLGTSIVPMIWIDFSPILPPLQVINYFYINLTAKSKCKGVYVTRIYKFIYIAFTQITRMRKIDLKFHPSFTKLDILKFYPGYIDFRWHS